MDLNPTFQYIFSILDKIPTHILHKRNRFVYIGWGVVGLENYFIWKFLFTLTLLTLLHFSNVCNAIEHPNCVYIFNEKLTKSETISKMSCAHT